MSTKFIDAKVVLDAKITTKRYRNILANSGELMESGEKRDVRNLYVMGTDGKLYKIADLATDPDKQTEEYTVQAQADHGEVIEGMLVPSIEKQFGSCKVWLEEDGLHARMYFAEGDPLADHAYAISEHASYSIGMDWYPDGYFGTGYEITEPIGILREISMVLTGNDPRAKTIDSINADAEAQGSASDSDGVANNIKEEKSMKKVDELTPDERKAMEAEIAGVIEKFTTDAPEDETEPTAVDTKDAEGEAEAPAEKAEEPKDEEVKEEKTDALTQNVIVIKDKNTIKQEKVMTKTTDAYLKTDAAVAAWGKALLDCAGDKDKFADAFRKQAKADGVDLGENVSLVPEAVINAVSEQIEDEDRIFSHVFHTGLNFEVAGTAASEGDAKGHVRGKTKEEEAVEIAKRVLVPADLYKLMKLDHSMVKINGGIGSSAIVRYILREMPRKLLDAIDQAILVGGISSDSNESGETEFDALLPIIADIADAQGIYGNEYTAEAGDTARAVISKAASRVVSGYDRTLITTEDALTDLENSLNGTFPVFPNGIDKNDPRINGIRRIITPRWLTAEMLGDYTGGIIVDLPSYHTVGDDTAEKLTDYDIDTNKYVWEVLACIGGGLVNKGAAVGIKASDES